MKRFPGMVFLIALFAVMPTLQAETRGGDNIVIDNVTVIDALHGRRTGMRVILQHDRITSVGPAGSATSPFGKSIDGSGKYLIPGLWDMHVHFTYDKAISRSMPSLFLANGITSVRDTGGPADEVIAWKAWAAARPGEAPRVFISGPLLDGEPTVYDGSSEAYPKLSITLSNVEAAEAMVDELAARGVDLLKAYEMLQPDVFRAVLRRAGYHGLPVTGHVPLMMSASEASTAGLDSIEHLRNLELSCSSDEDSMLAERRQMMAEPGDQPGSALRRKAHAAHRYRSVETLDWQRCQALLDLHKRNQTRHIPTLALINSVYRGYHTRPEWRATFDYLPADLRTRWLADSQKSAGMFDGDPEGAASRRTYVEWVERVIAYLAADGMLMAGTDTPIFFMNPGFSLHWELESLVDAGLTPLQVLEAATLTPARYFGLEHESGAIAEDMLADLVLLAADPLEDIRNTRRIEMVIRAGQVYERDALNRLLDQAPSNVTH